MANVVKDSIRIPGVAPSLTSGVTAGTAGTVFPINEVHTRSPTIIRRKVEIANLVFALTATSGGGAADAQGQKIMTLPAGKWAVLWTDFNFTVTMPAGYSCGTAVYSVGTAAATADNATLDSTEANICESQTLGDGTLAAAASETEDTTVAAPASNIVGGTVAAGDTDVYFNIAGNWIHATLTAATCTINGTVEIALIDTGAAS